MKPSARFDSGHESMPIKEFPRVCIVAANPLCSTTTNGIVMSSLFAGWPKERLSQIYFPVLVPYQPEFDVCTDFRMVRTSGRVAKLRAHRETERPGNFASQPRQPTARQRLLQYFRKHPLIHRPLKLIQEGWYAHSWVGSVVRKELTEIQPDIVFADLGNYCLTKVTCEACEVLELPLFIRVADDYVTSLYQNGPFASQLRAASQRWFERTVKLASGLAANSPVMAEEYRTRHGGNWQWYATLVDPEDYDPKPRQYEDKLRLVYTGNLGLGRWRSLRRLAVALRSLREDKGLNAELIIHTFPEQHEAFRKELEIPSVVELAGWVPFDELPKIYHGADLLVHAESFEKDITDYTALSFSGKLSQYMMAGRSILSLAPRHIASSRLVESVGAGRCLDQTDSDSLAGGLARLLSNRENIIEQGRRGREWALENVARRPAQERFRRGMAKAVRDYQNRRETADFE